MFKAKIVKCVSDLLIFIKKGNKTKKIAQILATIVFAFMIYIGCETLTFDKHAQMTAQTSINRQLSRKDEAGLKKISRDSETYNFLKRLNKVKINFTTDNQGSGNIVYYAAKINHSKPYFGIELKRNSFIPSRFTLISVRHF